MMEHIQGRSLLMKHFIRFRNIQVLFIPCLVFIFSSVVYAESPPEWVTRGPGVIQDGHLYAVGIAQGKKPASMLMRTADNRARANLAASLKSTVQTMSEDFEGSAISTDEMVTRILVYEGTVEVTDIEGRPETRTVLTPGEQMMVVVGEGFGEKQGFSYTSPNEDWDSWTEGAAPNTRD